MNEKKYLILSVDGGGLRGIIPVQFLKHIESRTGKRIHEMFHLISGTSTGGLIACALASGKDNVPRFTLSQIEDLYISRGKDIFPEQKGIKAFFRSIRAVFAPKFSSSGLEKVLNEKFEKTTLLDCIVPVIIPAYDLENNIELFFKTRHAVENPNLNTLLYNVCRCTSAGPTYLPSFEFEYHDQNSGKMLKRDCIDGGIYVNNPSIAALVEFVKPANTKYYTGIDISKLDAAQQKQETDRLWKNMMVLSLGTGHYTSHIKKAKTMGLAEWATKIADTMMQAVSQVTDYESKEILENGNFLRLQVDIDNPEFADMSDSSDATRNHLKGLAEKKLNDPITLKQIDDFLLKAGLLPAEGAPVV